MTEKFELMTIKEASQFLNVKVSNLRTAIFMRKIRYLKIGALIRFNKSDLIQWLEEQVVQPMKPTLKKSY